MAEEGLFEPRPDPRAGRKAQPSLFDIRQTPVRPELRYPRGYTPERMRAVRGATEDVISVPRYGDPSSAGKVPCATCAGKGHSPSFAVQPDIHLNPTTLEHWKNRGIVHNGVIAHAPGQSCWACGGKGTVPAARSTQRGMAETVDHPFYQPHGARMIQEGIARSTIPVQHLEGLRSIELLPERRVGRAGMGGTMGLYTPSSKAIRLFPQPAASPKRGRYAGQRVMESMGEPQPMAMGGWGRQRKTPVSEMVPVRSRGQQQKAEATLIHEIGHHVSKGPAGPPEEAAADRYMVEHWRPDPREVRKGTARDVTRMTYLHRLGGPYTAAQWEQTGVPTPQPKGRRRRKS